MTLSGMLGPWGAPLLVGDGVMVGKKGPDGEICSEPHPMFGMVAYLDGENVAVDIPEQGRAVVEVSDLVAHLDMQTGETKKASPPLPDELDLASARERLKFCGSFERMPWLLEIAWHLSPPEWLTLLGELWEVCDNVGHYKEELVFDTPFSDLIDSPVDLRGNMMGEEECVALAALPEVITIWRGCYASNKWGLSWSLEKDMAAKFPTLLRYRQAGQPLLVKAEIRRDDVLALKLGRGESEIVAIKPKHVATYKL